MCNTLWWTPMVVNLVFLPVWTNFASINGSLFEHNEWVTEHNVIKNWELWNNIISQCLSRMYLYSPWDVQQEVTRAINCVLAQTSHQRTTSEKRTKALLPKCPLFGGSTVWLKWNDSGNTEDLLCEDYRNASDILQSMQLQSKVWQICCGRTGRYGGHSVEVLWMQGRTTEGVGPANCTDCWSTPKGINQEQGCWNSIREWAFFSPLQWMYHL